MNLSDVKIGERLRTERGGVVVVTRIDATSFQGGNTFWWNFDGKPWIKNGSTEYYCGNIIGRESTMNYEKEITDLKARLAALEPKPEPKLPTEKGSIIQSGGVLLFNLGTDPFCWGSDVNRVLESSGGLHKHSIVEEFVKQNGGFTVGRVVWEAE